jgi:hypothetical protein
MKQTVFVAVAIGLLGVLIFLNYGAPVFFKSPLNPDQVEGIDVYHKGIPYTLNLSQQASFAAFLGESTEVKSPPNLQSNSIDVEKVLFYLLGEKKPLVLIPKGESVVRFTYYTFDGKWYKEPKSGRLKEFLETTYDH